MKRILLVSVILCILCSCLPSCANDSTVTVETINPTRFDDKDSYTFTSIEEFKKTAKANRRNYDNKRITVYGTYMTSDNRSILGDDHSYKSTLTGTDLMKRAEISRNVNLHTVIVFSDNVSQTTLESGDYLVLEGTVVFADGDIYLDDCIYEILAYDSERYRDP